MHFFGLSGTGCCLCFCYTASSHRYFTCPFSHGSVHFRRDCESNYLRHTLRSIS